GILDSWAFKISNYAGQLLANLDWIDWSEKVKTAQRNWIGESVGAEVRFSARVNGKTVRIPVFTTRPDTIYGVTFFVLAPEHPLVERMTAPQQHAAVQAYIEEVRRETEIERLSTDVERKKTGVPLGTTLTHPLTRHTAPVSI